MKRAHICFIILVRTSLRLPVILYQVNIIFFIAYFAPMPKPTHYRNTFKTLDLNKYMFWPIRN